MYRRALVLPAAAMFLACAPSVVHTQAKPGGLRLTGTMIRYGHPETTLVALSVKRLGHAPSWKASFTDGSAAEIVTEDIPDLTILKWQVEADRLKSLTKVPYKLTIQNGSQSYAVTVSFTTQAHEFHNAAAFSVLTSFIRL